MSARFVPMMLAFFVCGSVAAKDASPSASVSTDKQLAGQSTKKHKQARHAAGKRSRARRIASRLVPPPPAYMPSILPELYFQRNNTATQTEDVEKIAAKPVNPYARYFYSRQGDVPKATDARSGVATWATLR